MAEEQDPEPWRIPTGLGAPGGLQPSPGIAPPGGIAPPRLSDWIGFEPAAAEDALAIDTPDEVHAAIGAEPAVEAGPVPEPAQPQPQPQAPVPTPAPVPQASAPVAPPAAPAVAAPVVPTPAPSPAPASAPAPTPPVPPSAAPSKPGGAGVKPAKAIGWAGIGVLVVSAMAVIGGISSSDGDPDVDGTGTSVGAGDPESAVRDYLEALRDGDTGRAAELLLSPDPGVFEHPPLDPSEHPEGRIDDVEVSTSTEQDGSASVSASYTIGEETVSTVMQLESTDDGWFISEGGTVFPNGPVFGGFPTTLNGDPLSGPTPALLPGAYELGFETKDFSLPEEERTMVIRLADAAVTVPVEATPRLTEAGARRFVEALRSGLDECIAAGTPTTECGMDVSEEDLPDGFEFEGDLTRSLPEGFDAVLTAHPPELERVDGRLTGKVVLPAEFAANIELSIRNTADGTVRDGHLRDPVPSLRPSAYLSPGSVQLDWTEPDAA